MRQHSRFTFHDLTSIRVVNRLSGEPMGFVGDLSFGGLRLISRQPLAIGGCYEMRLHVPVEGGGVRQVDVVVICQWSRKETRYDSFDSGFALDRPAPEFAELVAYLLSNMEPEPF